MIDISVRLVGRYAYAQEAWWTVPCCSISLNISGLRWFRCEGVSVEGQQPFLGLHTAGMVSHFCYGPERENWVLLGDTPVVRRGPGVTAEIALGAEWIAVPRLVPLAREMVPRWQEEFLRLRDAYHDPTPANQLRLRLGFATLLRPFLDLGGAASISPAARLKRLIEDDGECRESIDRHSRRCGVHPDRLRQQFVAAYGLTPRAYRARCRLATAMSLIDGSGLSIGAIGRRVGFSHVSHFSSFFRKESGLSPREALQRYRTRG